MMGELARRFFIGGAGVDAVSLAWLDQAGQLSVADTVVPGSLPDEKPHRYWICLVLSWCIL